MTPSARSRPQLLQHLKRIISDLCKLYNLPQHPDVEMLDQPLPAEQCTQEDLSSEDEDEEMPEVGAPLPGGGNEQPLQLAVLAPTVDALRSRLGRTKHRLGTQRSSQCWRKQACPHPPRL